jgi:hypothetical protein
MNKLRVHLEYGVYYLTLNQEKTRILVISQNECYLLMEISKHASIALKFPSSSECHHNSLIPFHKELFGYELKDYLSIHENFDFYLKAINELNSNEEYPKN